MSMTETETGTLAFVASASTRTARSFAIPSISMSYSLPQILNHERVNWNPLARTSEHSAPKFPHIKSEAIFHVARLVKALVEQLLHSLLRGRPRNRVNAGIPPCCHFGVRRQARSVDKVLRIADRPLFDRADPS